MRTRYKSFEDYGLEEGEAERIKELCRKNDLKTSALLVLAAFKTNPTIMWDMIVSLKFKLSYEKLNKIHEVLALKEDFYAYRRRCLGYFKYLLEGQKQ